MKKRHSLTGVSLIFTKESHPWWDGFSLFFYVKINTHLPVSIAHNYFLSSISLWITGTPSMFISITYNPEVLPDKSKLIFSPAV